ncbi:hypothetical protein ACTRUI_09780 [Streptococcus pneumoniae]
MDNVEWSHADSYFLSFVSDDVEERFECQVLREIETEDEEAYLVRSVGTSLEQYPDYDGFDYEEW